MIATSTRSRARKAKKKSAKRAGRPPLPEKERLGNPIPVRFREDELDVIGEAVGDGERARFIRDAAVEKARRLTGRE